MTDGKHWGVSNHSLIFKGAKKETVKPLSDKEVKKIVDKIMKDKNLSEWRLVNGEIEYDD